MGEGHGLTCGKTMLNEVYIARWTRLDSVRGGSFRTEWRVLRSPFRTLCGYGVPETAEVRKDRGTVDCETCLRILLHGGV